LQSIFAQRRAAPGEPLSSVAQPAWLACDAEMMTALDGAAVRLAGFQRA
jgi:hypothetical protein